MSRWVRVAHAAECPPGCSLETVVDGRIVALFNVGGEYYALDGVCPHQGGPLGKGSLSGRVVTCPWHGWQFDVCTGCHLLRPSLVQPRYAVRLAGDEILLEIGDSS